MSTAPSLLTLSLHPRDLGFDPRVLDHRVILPDAGPLRVDYLTPDGARCTVAGGADVCALVLRAAGYLVAVALPTGRDVRLEPDGWHVQPPADNWWMGPFATLALAVAAYHAAEGSTP